MCFRKIPHHTFNFSRVCVWVSTNCNVFLSLQWRQFDRFTVSFKKNYHSSGKQIFNNTFNKATSSVIAISIELLQDFYFIRMKAIRFFQHCYFNTSISYWKFSFPILVVHRSSCFRKSSFTYLRQKFFSGCFLLKIRAAALAQSLFF